MREVVMDDNRRREGARAFNRGMERDQCPHAPGTPAFRSWVEGWKQQKAEFQLRLEYERSAVRVARAV